MLCLWPDTTLRGAEGRNPEVTSPLFAMLVIKEAPPGAQVFIDDRLAASVDSAGQAEISSLIPGQHNLRLTDPKRAESTEKTAPSSAFDEIR